MSQSFKSMGLVGVIAMMEAARHLRMNQPPEGTHTTAAKPKAIDMTESRQVRRARERRERKEGKL